MLRLPLGADISTPEFTAALHRFSNGRGTLSHIYSDNGTNFQGASNELENLITSKSTKIAISHFATDKNVRAVGSLMSKQDLPKTSPTSPLGRKPSPPQSMSRWPQHGENNGQD